LIKKTLFLLLVLSVSLYSQTKFVPGSILLRIEQPFNLNTVNGRDITGIQKLDSILDRLNVRKLRKPFGQTVSSYGDKDKILSIDLPKTIDLDYAVQLLKQVDGVSWAVKHNIYESSFIPDDPLYADQYYLPQVKADEGWDLLGSGANMVIIGIIDSGVEYTHPDLVSKIYLNPGEDKPPLGELTPADYDGIDDDLNGLVDDLVGWDFVDAPDLPVGQDYLNPDNDPMDTYGHGTAIAGIAAAEYDNGIGIAGIAPNAMIMPLRSASADLFTETAVVAAILYAIDEGVDVLNLSFGTEVNSPLLQDVIAFAAGNDVILVASAGNYGSEVTFYPAAYDQTISVGAVDANDFLADFSYHGETMDIVAPGVGLISTILNGGYGLTLDGGTGTSFAVPLVSGAAAMIKGQHPDYTNEETKGILLATADDLYTPGWDTQSANGRLNIKSALMIPAGISAFFNEPLNGSAFNEDTLQILGTVVGSALTGFKLFYGIGENPPVWTELRNYHNKQVVNQAIGYLAFDSTSVDTSYTLKLEVTDLYQNVLNEFVTFNYIGSAPEISDLNFYNALNGTEHSQLVHFKTNQPCTAEITVFDTLGNHIFIYNTLKTEHSYTINQSDFYYPGIYDCLIEISNAADLTASTGTLDSVIVLNQPEYNTGKYFLKNSNLLPNGYLLNRTMDFDGDGWKEVLLKDYTSDSLKLYEYSPGSFQFTGFSYGNSFPRDIGDLDADGLQEILIQSPNTYEIYEQETTDQPPNFLWYFGVDGEEGSRLLDLNTPNGHGGLFIQTEDAYMLSIHYESGIFQIGSIFSPNNSSEEKGQPFSEWMDMNGDGFPEAVFGDYSGQIYLYSANQDFEMDEVFRDSLPYFAAGDYLASGDFDGDSQRLLHQ